MLGCQSVMVAAPVIWSVAKVLSSAASVLWSVAKMKLKECQEVRVRSYQHQKNYVKGDKVWYQYKDGNAWYGPGEVIYQKGNTVFMHSNGDVKKVAVCKVKPYELIERNEEEKDENRWNKIVQKYG